jgi:FlaA1/EpsC-like NDP-sugar epimerase
MDKKFIRFYRDKKILILGAAGTIGRGLIEKFLALKVAQLTLVDNDETGIFYLLEEYKSENIFSFTGDVRDREKIEKLAKGIDIIIHLAAYKHVVVSEHNPFDVVQTNIIGLENIIRAATACNVKYILFASSDKAVNPTNVMGASKLMGEKLITAANIIKDSSDVIFSNIRFGNVIGSRGSVVPHFTKQIMNGGPVTITDMRMTRFIMTVSRVADMVLESIMIAKGGEVFVPRMPVIKIPLLAEVMIELLAPKYGYNVSDIEIVEIGDKPGEKLYEELMSEEESPRSIMTKDMYVITPPLKAIYHNVNYTYPNVVNITDQESYKSCNGRPMSKKALKRFLKDNCVLEEVDNNLLGGIM